MQDTDFRLGDSITVEVSNRPYVNRDVTPSQNDLREATSAWIAVYDPCDNLFIDCPMTACSDRIGYYLYRIQTDDNYPLGLYKIKVTLTNTVPESLNACTSGTSATSGTPDYSAINVAWKNFKLISSEVF